MGFNRTHLSNATPLDLSELNKDKNIKKEVNAHDDVNKLSGVIPPSQDESVNLHSYQEKEDPSVHPELYARHHHEAVMAYMSYGNRAANATIAGNLKDTNESRGYKESNLTPQAVINDDDGLSDAEENQIKVLKEHEREVVSKVAAEYAQVNDKAAHTSFKRQTGPDGYLYVTDGEVVK